MTHADLGSDDPVLIPVEAYLSPEYARAEEEHLWTKVWQVACREEEIANVGDFHTYDILDQSIIVVRTSPEEISAYFNVCPHRGRRLTEGCGAAKQFHCRFHGWQWNLAGENIKVLDREEWGEGLKDEDIHLGKVKVGTWAGYVFINMDPDCEPLDSFLDPLPHWLDPFEIGKMRYKWRQWLHVGCNWKTAIEAFNEGYHVAATHPQLLRYYDGHTWSRAHGLHSCFGNVPRDGGGQAGGGTTTISNAKDVDARKAVAEMMSHLYETVGHGATTTQTIVDAARRLVDVLPETAAPMDAVSKMMELAATADAERGVAWPNIDPQHFMESGVDWHVFPNSIILHGVTFVLGYRARPHGFDPDSCIFEVYALERFPEGEEPKPDNIHEPDLTEERWRLVLAQDFSNMAAVQQGMKSKGFKGARPNPQQEAPVINFHRNLADYMNRGRPQSQGDKG